MTDTSANKPTFMQSAKATLGSVAVAARATAEFTERWGIPKQIVGGLFALAAIPAGLLLDGGIREYNQKSGKNVPPLGVTLAITFNILQAVFGYEGGKQTIRSIMDKLHIAPDQGPIAKLLHTGLNSAQSR